MKTSQGAPSTDVQLVGGRYEVGRVLGRGGMADVVRARDRLLEREVAVKIFRPATASGLDGRGHSAEIRALAGLRHPGLVSLLDAGTDRVGAVDERTYLVMELVGGPSLADRLARGPLEPAAALALGAALAGTLAYIHSRGVIHRDIKPANILIDDTTAPATPRLTDFGVARLIDSARITEAGMTVGTANYLSPEQACGADIGAPSDVYSLGLVLLECLTGRTEYPGAGVAAAAARLHRDPVVPAHLDARWRGVLAAMTSRDPSLRPTAAHVADVLLGRLEAPAPVARDATTTVLPAAAPIGGSTITMPVAPQPRRRRRAAWAAPAIGAALLAVVIAVAAASSGGAPVHTPTPPAYPAASGALGTSLRQLESLVGASKLSAAAQLRLQSDTLALARAISYQDVPSARAALGDLGSDVASLQRAGELGASDAGAVSTQIATISGELTALLPTLTPSPAPTSAPSDGNGRADNGKGSDKGQGG